MSLNEYAPLNGEDQNQLNSSNIHYMVGVGASAGGLEAIHELFDNLPGNTGFSFIIVQHLSPDYKSLMSELLVKHTSMTVYNAEDNTRVEPNCIYFIPNNKLMTIKHGRLKLTDKKVTKEPNRAIDIFFNSLAEDQREKAIGIILSGTGTDGTDGISSIKKYGGFTIAQEPHSAKFDGMPNSAISSGNIDVIATPELMFEEINTYVKEPAMAKSISEAFNEKDESLLREVFALIRNYTAVDFTYYKRPTIIRRIARRMLFNKIEKLNDYLDYLYTNPKEVTLLGKEFLIGVTKFFRDTEAFDTINQKVIPEIIRSKELKSEPLKIWITGCSTGEEAYSFAILIKEYLLNNDIDLTVKIFATDIDKDAIEFASKGCYSSEIEKTFKQDRLEKFFIKEKDKYLITSDIRKMVIFAPHDLIKDPPFSRIDLVTCRNLLIYLSPPLQKKVLASLHFALNLGGYLFIGPSENLGELNHFFIDIDRKWKIYKNNEIARLNYKDSFVTPDLNLRNHQTYSNGYASRGVPPKDHYTELLFDAAFDEFGYAGVYIDENYEIIEARGDIRKFMILPEKKFDLNILKMLPDGASIALGAGLHKAVKRKEKISLKSIKIRDKKKITFIDITIKPLLEETKLNKKSILLLFSESKIRRPFENDLDALPEEFKANERIKELEHDLIEAQNSLQSAIEEIETSNEELQSSNEELISANEELQSTNEELQSLNEELHTVNSEHQQKIKELIELNDDLNNYFSSTDIGQIFIDKNLLIRKFTPSVTHQINLIESDIGRPIFHISHNFKYDLLIDDIRDSIRNQKIITKEVELSNGKFYLLKIQPYIRQDKNTDGVVISFIDITQIKNLNNLVSGTINNSVSGIMAFKAIRDRENKIQDFEWILINKKAENIIEKKSNDLIGKKLTDELLTTRQEGLLEKYKEVVENNSILDIEYFSSRSGMDKWYNVVAVKLGDGFSTAFTDITDKKIAEQKINEAYYALQKAQEELKNLNEELERKVRDRTKELSTSDERFRLISQATNDAIRDWNLLTNEIWWNDSFKSLFGYKDSQIENGIESWYNRIHPQDRTKTIDSINKTINEGGQQWVREYRFLRNDGSYASILERGKILRDMNAKPYRMIGSMMDMTDLRQAQEDLKRTNEELLKINQDFLKALEENKTDKDKVSQINVELIQKNHELVKINNDLDNFIYTASHDLKAPVSNIEGLVHALTDTLGDTSKDNETVHSIISMITASIDRFKNTIQDLTEITKIQKNLEHELTSIDIPEMIEDVKLSIRDMIIKNDAKITVECNCPNIIFSKKNFKSILYNLVSNAIKYRAFDRKPEVTIIAKELEDYNLLMVEDNGLGIEDKKKVQMFSMFKRFHDHVEGTGVGLYIVKRIIDNAGGKIEVDSEVDKGTRFKVYFKK